MRLDDPRTHVDDLLPSYVAGALGPDAARRAQEHLAWCAACRTSLAAWREVAGALRESEAALPPPSPRVLVRALAVIDGEHAAPRPGAAARDRLVVVARLLGEQGRAIPRALWIGAAAALLVAGTVAGHAHTVVAGGRILSTVAALVAALGVAGLVGPALRTRPTSGAATVRFAVLTRCGLALGYILLLVSATSAAVALAGGGQPWSLGPLWLGPVLLLAAVSLLLSLLARPAIGATSACGLCLIHALVVLIGGESALSTADLVARILWATNPVVLALSGLLVLGAAVYAPRAVQTTP